LYRVLRLGKPNRNIGNRAYRRAHQRGQNASGGVVSKSKAKVAEENDKIDLKAGKALC